MTDALDAVIDAALERAVLDAADARRYFALAGALERGRAAARAGGVGTRQSDHGTPRPERPTSRADPTDVLGAALLSTAAVGALDADRDGGIDPGAWSPGDGDGGTRAELVAVGAAACRRLDVEPGTVAARSGLPPERLARHRTDGDGAAGSK